MTLESYAALGIQTALPTAFDPEQVRANVATVCGLVKRGVRAHADFGPPVRLVVLPEFAFHGVPFASAEKLDASGLLDLSPELLLAPLQELADRLEVHVVAGSLYVRGATRDGSTPEGGPAAGGSAAGGPVAVYNQSFLLSPGLPAESYRKLFPWTPIELSQSPFDAPAGDDPLLVVDRDIGRLGVIVCFDSFFPELWQALGDRGVDVVAVPTALMAPFASGDPQDVWKAMCRTRSVDTKCYQLAVNQGASVEQFPPYAWSGGSYIIGPEGEVLAGVQDAGTRFVWAEIDLARLQRCRAGKLMNQVGPIAWNYRAALRGLGDAPKPVATLTGRTESVRREAVARVAHDYYDRS